MKKNLLVLSIIAAGAAILLLACLLPPKQSRRERATAVAESGLVGEIRDLFVTENPERLQELRHLAARARYNKKTLDIAAYFFARADYNTLGVMHIARVAADANHEIAHLDEIMEICIIYGSETFNIMALADKAASGRISEADLKAEIAAYREKAEAKTVDEAIEMYG